MVGSSELHAVAGSRLSGMSIRPPSQVRRGLGPGGPGGERTPKEERVCLPCALSLHCSFLVRPGTQGGAHSSWLPRLLTGSAVTFVPVCHLRSTALTETWRSPLKAAFVPDAPIPQPSPQCPGGGGSPAQPHITAASFLEGEEARKVPGRSPYAVTAEAGSHADVVSCPCGNTF